MVTRRARRHYYISCSDMENKDLVCVRVCYCLAIMSTSLVLDKKGSLGLCHVLGKFFFLGGGGNGGISH